MKTMILLFMFLCGVVIAEEEPLLPALKEIKVSGPYCGVYALVACLDTFDIDLNIEELLVSEFIGSFEGSSNVELIKAAEKFGLHGKTYSGLTWQELAASKSPMILHFRSTYSDSKFNHWVAYLGVDGGKARIIDFPHRIATIPFAELLAKWDGSAVEISETPIHDEILSATRWNYLSLVLSILGVIVFLKVVFWNNNNEAFATSSFRYKIKRAFLQTAILLGVIFVLGVLFHAFSEIGFLKNPSAVAEVTRRYYSIDVPEIDLAEMEAIVAEKSIPIFDARYVRDFSQDTIPGAKSLSINSTLTERQETLGSASKSQRIVVFCQSSGCGYADEVAQFLKFNGYENVAIYRGGYREWSQNHDDKK